MKEYILRALYRRFAAKFNDYLVEDYLHQVPNQVREQTLEVMSTHKRKFQKLTGYLAYSLHRRMANDPRNSERYQGMFVQLKIFDQMIQGRPEPEETEVVTATEVKFNYDQAIEKASNFASKFKETNTQENI